MTRIRSVVALSLLATGCAAAPVGLPRLAAGEVGVLGLPTEARVLKTEIGPITMGLLPERRGAGKEDDTPLSVEEQDVLSGSFGALKAGGRKLPPKADLREYFPPIRNQGALGSCTAFATTGLMEAMWRMQGSAKAKTTTSPLFFYYAERKQMEASGDMPKATKKDTGAWMGLAATTAVKIGACPEAQLPYQDGKPGLAYDASPADYEAAKGLRMKAKARIKTLDGMKSSLANKKPFILGILLYQSFMTRTVMRTGEMMLPLPGEAIEGGHAVCAVGYDDAKQAFLVRNSWGDDWGQGGYFWMPYSYFRTSLVGKEAYGECFTLE